MYSITTTSTGGTIEFDTIPEIENFLAEAVYGIILQYQVENEGVLPVDAVASVILANFHVPGVEIDSRKVADRVRCLV